MEARRASTSLAMAAALLLFFASPSAAEESPGAPCQTPSNQTGDCRRIDACEPLRELLRHKPVPTATADLLRRSVCRFAGKTPYVCCPLSGGGGANGGNAEDPATHPNIRLLDTDSCGPDIGTRIIPGEEIYLAEYPWLTLLQYQTSKDKQFLCGGALINERYILTAAHCVRGLGNTRLVGVRLGEHDTDTDPDCEDTEIGKYCSDPVQDFGVDEVIAHPQYSTESNDRMNDIALIRLDRPAPITDFIQAICLPLGESISKSYEGKTLNIGGWGKAENRSGSNLKLRSSFRTITNTACAPLYQKNLSVNQMCAENVGKRNTCHGDSGGPLMYYEFRPKGAPRLLATGISSIEMSQCGAEGNPIIYTRVGPYVNWILDNLKP